MLSPCFPQLVQIRLLLLGEEIEFEFFCAGKKVRKVFKTK